MRRSWIVDLTTASRLDLEPSDVDRVERRFAEDAETDRRTQAGLVGAVLAMIVLALLVGLTTLWLGGVVGLPRPWPIVAAATTILVMLIAIWITLVPRAVRPGIRRSLRACGFDVCERCGYDLSARAIGTACPECGRVQQSALAER